MNMRHCRFENTLYALMECSDALAEIDGLEDLQTSEAEAARKLIKLCAEIACDWSGDDQLPAGA
jgi:hypothetical protein